MRASAFLLALLLLLGVAVPLVGADKAAPTVNSGATFEVVEAQIVTLTNLERSKAGLPPLAADGGLQKVSRGHSAEMATLNYFDHESPTPGRKFPWDRANLAGIDSANFGENIYFAEGYPLPELAAQTVRAWMKSPYHRENIMSLKFSTVGLGISGVGSQFYVTEIFAAAIEPMAK